MYKFILKFCVLLFVENVSAFALVNFTDHGVLIEGDIMVPSYFDAWDRRNGPLVDMRKNRWPSGIVPYDFNDTEYSLLDRYVINEALEVIEKASCVKFVQRSDEKDYILITPYGGCWSFVGKQGDVQILSLVVPHCMNKGTVIHEFMHALGFWHEHSRSDRDQYIEILWDNVVNEEKQVNFAKSMPEASNFLDFHYDYQSVMHYDAYAFSKSPRLPTMRPKDPRVRLRDMGRAKAIGTLTQLDEQKLNYLYECESRKNL